MYIYKTTNIITGKIYVGYDTYDQNSKKAQLYFGSGNAIKAAIKKYGKHNFTKEIIDTAKTFKELCEKEIFWIAKLNATDQEIGYNIRQGGQGHGLTAFNAKQIGDISKCGRYIKTEKGWICIKKKVVVVWNKGKKLGKAKKQHILNRVKGRKGYKHSEETKQKMRQSYLKRIS